jgi:oligopeptide/dipeptide ABC transporter ATP-binding protein
MAAGEPILRVQNLSTHFATRRGVVQAVNHVSFELAAGETLGIVGESGSGKSVTALSILRAVPEPGRVVGGQVLFEGKDLLKLPEHEMRLIRGRRIAMVPQDPLTALNPVLRIGDQITEVLRIHLGLRGQQAEERAVDLLEMVGIPGAASRLRNYPHQLSGGMRQRVMIAIAIACDPAMLIADEPTTALDATIQAQILELIDELKSRLGMAVILITHNLGIVAGHCDRALVMYAGRIAETAAVRPLFAQPQHPYTLGLLACVPRLDRALSKTTFPSIAGTPPDLISPPSGCPFHPRCPRATEQCSAEMPPLGELFPRHHAACWHPSKDKPATHQPEVEAALQEPAAIHHEPVEAEHAGADADSPSRRVP